MAAAIKKDRVILDAMILEDLLQFRPNWIVTFLIFNPRAWLQSHQECFSDHLSYRYSLACRQMSDMPDSLSSCFRSSLCLASPRRTKSLSDIKQSSHEETASEHRAHIAE